MLASHPLAWCPQNVMTYLSARFSHEYEHVNVLPKDGGGIVILRDISIITYLYIYKTLNPVEYELLKRQLKCSGN